MKKIITLLFFVGLLGSAFAQDGKRDHNRGNTDQYQSSGYSKDHNYGNSKSYSANDDYNNNRQWNNSDEKGYGRNKRDYGDRDNKEYNRQPQNHYPQYDNRKTQKLSWLGIVLNVVIR